MAERIDTATKPAGWQISILIMLVLSEHVECLS